MPENNNGYEKINVTSMHEGQVIHIELASPPGNVLDAQTMKEIGVCLENEAKADCVKALVFEGTGKHFCFGASVPEHKKDQAPQMIAGFHSMFKAMLATEVPLIAVVRGQCLGGGMELAAFCSFIIAEPGAKFGQPEIQLGVLPPVAAAILPGIIGQSRADDLILTGRSIDAETAHAWGLVSQVTEDGKAALEKFLTKFIVPKSAASLRHAYRATRYTWFKQLGATLDEMEHLYVKELMETHDANEGIESFLAKRPAQWKNK